MNKTSNVPSDGSPFVTMPVLMSRYGLGRESCEKAARDAKAVIKIGRRRLYNVKKIDEHLWSISE